MAPFRSSKGKDSIVSKLLRISSASKLGLGLGAGAAEDETFQAVGGITQVYTHPNGNDYKSHKFTANGTFTVTSGTSDVDVLLVGGGGGGGGSHGGGGGAGGFKVLADLSVLTQVYPVTVGAGGNRGTQNNEAGSKGGDSVVFSQTAEGGGGGGSYAGQVAGDGQPGLQGAADSCRRVRRQIQRAFARAAQFSRGSWNPHYP